MKLQYSLASQTAIKDFQQMFVKNIDLYLFNTLVSYKSFLSVMCQLSNTAPTHREQDAPIILFVKGGVKRRTV